MYEVTYPATVADFQTVLRSIDRAYPGTPGAPAPAWLNYSVRVLKWLLPKMLIWVGVFALIMLTMMDGPIRMWHVSVVAIISLASGATVFWSVQDQSVMRCIEGYVERSGEPTVRLTDDGVEVLQGVTQSFTPWRAYSHVEITSTHLFLFQSGTPNHVPVSAFASDEILREFAKFAAAKITENGASHDVAM